MSRDISRRVTLAWVAAASALPYAASAQEAAAPAPWNDAAITPLTGPGYGQDPDLQHPSVPWPLTLNPHQRETLRIAADLMLPADKHSSSGGTLHLDAFLDEWISAPYPDQQRDRVVILQGLEWLDAECRQRFNTDFAGATNDQRRTVFDLIAWRHKIAPGYERPAQFFARMRGLMMLGFYSLPEGAVDIGYMGNTPSLGPYAGPTPEALRQLNEAMANMGLRPAKA
jgi:hypothetical protein